MAKKKAKKKKRARASSSVPLRVRILLGLLIGVVAAGIFSVKFFDTTRGRVILLDLGITGYYNQVQEEIDGPLRAVLRSQGLQASMKETVKTAAVGGQAVYYRSWQVTCPGACDFVDINVVLTGAVKGLGAIVRSGAETTTATGRAALHFKIGSRTYTTHEIVIRRRALDARGPRGGDTGDPGRSSKGSVRSSQARTADDAAGRTTGDGTGRVSGDTPRRTADNATQRPSGGARPPQLALVIDDFGYSRSELIEGVLGLDLPITISIIPSLPQTHYTIARAKAVGKEAILHVPMEAEEYASDVTAVTSAMRDDEIASLLKAYIEANPGVVGVNNHLGSAATQDARVMGSVMAAIKAHDLFFLDSLTSNKSIAYNTAKHMGVPTGKNDLFLDDNTEDDMVVEERLFQLVEIARRRGRAIGIGHPRPWTYEALQRNVEWLKTSGVELVFVSELME